MARTARIQRKTAETDIELELNLDGTGQSQIDTGVGFFDHMLVLLAKHGALDLNIKAVGDLHVDQHHTVEDVGICLGQAVKQAVGDKAGIRRYGHFTLPMEEALATTAIDLSGRFYLVFEATFPTPTIGSFDSQLVEDFWQAFAANALCNLHVVHTPEGLEKAAADLRRLIGRAVEHGGRYFLTYHRWATREQVLGGYPQFVEFLKLKKKHDPQERFQSEWYRHYRTMFADVL